MVVGGRLFTLCGAGQANIFEFGVTLANQIPVIDVFAGPGGLGEGFAALQSQSSRPFRIALSIEKDVYAHRTLQLRSFWRQFNPARVPDEYFAFARQEITEAELYHAWPKQAEAAEREAWHVELGSNICPSKTLRARINSALCSSKSWVLIGGPPCQAYSLVGRARRAKVKRSIIERDERHTLYRHYLDIISTHAPPVFVMENVKGMLSSTHNGRRIVKQILDDLECPNKCDHQYRLYSFVNEPRGLTPLGNPEFDAKDYVIRSEDYGIPQNRHRVIILGVRADVERRPSLIQPSSHVSLASAISDLPSLRSSVSSRGGETIAWHKAIKDNIAILSGMDVDADVMIEMNMLLQELDGSISTGGPWMSYRPGRASALAKNWYRHGLLKGVCNHEARSHMPSDLARYFFASCFARVRGRSPVLANFPTRLLPKHSNVVDGVRGAVFADRFRVQVSDRPATTVTSHIAKDGHYYIHPDPLQCRSLTVREAARLQTFPDSYIFLGPRTSQYQQVGNAVPPLLARQLAEVVYMLLQ